jgi:NADH-quinone oxidoreductase subunit M
MLSSVGLPGLNGFVGEILCLFGVFKANKILAILAVTTIILAAAYLLWMFQRVMQGPITNDRVRSFKDLNLREIIYLTPIVFLMFWMGIYPQTFLRKMDVSVSNLLNQVKRKEAIFTEAKKENNPPTYILMEKEIKTDSIAKEDKESQ